LAIAALTVLSGLALATATSTPALAGAIAPAPPPAGEAVGAPASSTSPTSSGPSAAAGRIAGSIDAGATNSCAIGADGQARCWGDDAAGQTTIPAGLGTIAAITAATTHTCALKTNGTLACWGTAASYEPLPTTTFIAIAAGNTFTCGIDSSSVPSCWGTSTYGETTIPTGLGSVKAIAAGYRHVCVIKIDATVACWGTDANGQTTVPPTLGTVSAITAGAHHSCAIKTDGTATCWGGNGNGQATVPAALGTVTAITAGDFHTCAIKTASTAACWGSNLAGQIVVPADLGAVTMITGGGQHTCAVTAAGTPRCWGFNGSGRTTPPAGTGSLNRPTVVASEGWFSSATNGCGIRADSALACWSVSPFMQTPPNGLSVSSISLSPNRVCAVRLDGDGMCSTRYPYQPVPGGTGTVTAIATADSGGTGHTCVIKTDSSLSCWGDDSFGQITIPPGLGPVSSVVTTTMETCVVKIDGTPVCWGTRATTYPIPAGIGKVRDIQITTQGACVIKVDGTVACWGIAGWEPFIVPANLGTVTALTMASAQTCAIRSDGTTSCWGYGTPAVGSFASLSIAGPTVCGVTLAWVPTCSGVNDRGQTDLGITLSPSLALANNTFVEFRLRPTSMADAFTVAGTLPPGMSFTSDGRLSGTPTQNGTFLFTINALRNGVVIQARDFTAAVTFVVSKSIDEVDTSIGDGLCTIASGGCSLRAAVQEANADAGADVIRLGTNAFMTRSGMLENATATGDLDITDDLTIYAANSVIDGGELDRVFHLVGDPNVTIESATIRNGKLNQGYGDGGGILVSGGSLKLWNSRLMNNSSNASGGAIHVARGATLETQSTNVSTNTGGIGGGISGAPGSSIAIKGNSWVTYNDAVFGGGVSSAGSLTLTAAIVASNNALASGGGVWATGTMTVNASSFSNNTAADYGGAIGGQGTTTIGHTAITSNTAKYGAGVAVDGTAIIGTSLLADNHPAPGGYATEIFNLGNLTVNTSQIDASASTMASAVFNGGSTWNRHASLTINNTTIASLGRASTIRNEAGAGSLTLTNTIVQSSVDPAFPANPAGACAGSISTGVITSGGYNLISDGTCQFIQIGDAQGVDPQLGPLTYTNGLRGRFPGPPAIGTGKPDCSGSDYRGLPRPQSGSCDKGSIDV